MKDSPQPQLPLSDSDVERYSRQVIVPEVGAAGQAKLLAASVAVAGNRLGVAQASRYLAASGMRTIAYSGVEAADCYVFAGIDEVEARARDLVLGRQASLAWYAIQGSTITSGSDCASARAHFGKARRPDPASAAPSPDLHAVAGCDAAAVAIALVLGWNNLERDTEVDLA